MLIPTSPELSTLSAEIATLLTSKGESISVCETATGGLTSASLLAVPGASKYYKGGLTLYTLESRLAFGGWAPTTVSTYNGPTPEIVENLAKHVRETLGSTYTVSESGTAGPGGSGSGRNRKPGYVALGLAREDGKTWTKEVETGLGGDREANMIAFAVEALKLVRDVIAGEEGGK
ncbi:MAG: hypothetical protein M1834_008361 [Cirrosporium novae-zelandiae]|nr:MAG: hypothetical protein M1834_008361 [Cirrosporium novae-zelandiae]